MNQALYLSLLAQARRKSRRTDEAEDLLQSALLAAVEAGRSDLSNVQNRRWLAGVLRNRAAFDARSAIRRRAREEHALPALNDPTEAIPTDFIDSLPKSLRSTALLALTGHTRTEITYLLRLTDAALRQRIAQIRRRWRLVADSGQHRLPDLNGTLPYGLIRRALRHRVGHTNATLGSHDPDGHLFMISSAHKTALRGNTDM